MTIYEFKIHASAKTVDDVTARNNSLSVWESIETDLADLSKEWELVSVHPSIHHFPGTMDRPETKAEAISVWRRPLQG